MAETDLIWMSLLVFLPSLFAVALIFFPRKATAAMCWWSLTGTAVTLGVSVAIFIQYKVAVLDHAGVMKTKEERQSVSLEARTSLMDREVGSSEEVAAND